MITANSDSMHYPGKGNIYLNQQLKLSNVLHCPNLAMNLLSVSQLCDLGLIVKFDKQHVTVTRNGVQGARKGGLYIYKTTNAGTALVANSAHRTELFHRRMGHDATRYMTIYLLRSKTDVGSAFIDYDTKMFNMTTRHVTTMRSDGGTEYFRSSIATYCAKHGIHQQSSTPYTPQHNSSDVIFDNETINVRQLTNSESL
jgi:hypothetical protein